MKLQIPLWLIVAVVVVHVVMIEIVSLEAFEGDPVLGEAEADLLPD